MTGLKLGTIWGCPEDFQRTDCGECGSKLVWHYESMDTGSGWPSWEGSGKLYMRGPCPESWTVPPMKPKPSKRGHIEILILKYNQKCTQTMLVPINFLTNEKLIKQATSLKCVFFHMYFCVTRCPSSHKYVQDAFHLYYFLPSVSPSLTSICLC